MQFDGKTYTFLRASDLDRDGMGLECYHEEPGGASKLVLEAFWHDPSGRFTVRFFEEELPFALLQTFLRKAASGCPPLHNVEAGTRTLIYVNLLNEGTEVWRPVAAEIVPGGAYKIVGENSVPEDEQWEFTTGQTVVCEEHQFQDGTIGLVAKQRAS